MPLVHNYDFDAPYATVEQLSPLVRRVVCNNPGPFTYKGTSTFIVGHGRVAVIDPGPVYGPHIDALMAAIGPEESIAAIMITHTHPDHSLGAEDLHQRTGAPRFGFGPHAGGSVPEEPEDEPVDFSAYISDDEQKAFAAEWEALPPEVKFEGYDLDFTPDHSLSDGETIDGDGWSLRAVHTPGHCSNHLCYELAEENTLFSGDHVMGWATTVISPPDGAMAAYMESLHKVANERFQRFRPTHGPAIDAPADYVRELIVHRQARESQILELLADGPKSISDMVPIMYAAYDKRLWYPAVGSVWAHMQGLVDTGRVGTDDSPARRSSLFNRV